MSEHNHRGNDFYFFSRAAVGEIYICATVIKASNYE
jgi:hypothetical protein